MSKKIQIMRDNWDSIKNEINGAVKMLPSIMKANGIEFDIFSADCPPGIMELIGVYLRLIKESDKFVNHCLDMYEEQSRKMDSIEHTVEHIDKYEAHRYDALMEELKEVKELLNKKELPAINK